MVIILTTGETCNTQNSVTIYSTILYESIYSISTDAYHNVELQYVFIVKPNTRVSNYYTYTIIFNIQY